MSALITQEYLSERAARGDKRKFNKVLAKVKNVKPDEEDRDQLR